MAWISASIDVDFEQVFAHVARDGQDVVWLDSAQGDAELGARSLLALSLSSWFELPPTPEIVQPLHEDFSPLWARLDAQLAEFHAQNVGCPTGVVGYIAYEAAYLADRAIGIPHAPAPIPLFSLMRVDVGLVRQGATTELVVCAETASACEALLDVWSRRLRSLPPLEAPVHPPLELLADEDPAHHGARIDATRAAILDGRVYQGCLTYPLRFRRPADMPSLYRTLRQRAPADYCAFLRFGALEVASTSPERFFEVDGRDVQARPMKGTRRRGSAPDGVLREELRSSAKDQSENVMIVDLLRNDLGRVCEVDSIAVRSLFEIETYATVLQMTSTIVGRLEEGIGPFQCARALFPPGSMTGAPKIEACALIGELESGPRGVYSGALAWVDGRGRATFSVVIRALQAWDSVATWHVGGGIVWESRRDDEWDETRAKAETILRVT